MPTSGYWRDLQRQRITRRRLLAGAATGAAGLAVAAACGGDDNGNGANGQPTQADAGTPVYGGRFLNGTSALIETLDPHLGIGASTAFFPRIFNLLVARSPLQDDFFYYDLALEFEQPDETTWIFSLRPGVKIAPNDIGIPERDMDAQDLFESFERIKNEPQASGAVFVQNWFASHEASADGMTYTVTTPSPYAWFLYNIGAFTSMTAPRELLDHPDLASAGVGAGPFVVAPGGYSAEQRLILDRNPNYYRTDPNNNDAQLPYVDGMDLNIIPDRAALRAAFQDAQTHTYMAESEEEADDLVANYDVSVISTEPSFFFIAVTMNVERPPFDDPNVRKAVMHSINRQQYIDLIYGGDARPNGLVHWPTGNFALPEEELDELQPYDPELSRRLLTEAGHDLPLNVTVHYPATELLEHDKHVPIFLQQMQDAGFSVQEEAQELGSWIGTYTNKDYTMSLALNQLYDTPETPLNFQHSQGPFGVGLYSTGLQDPAIDAEIDRVKTITDPAALLEAVHDVQRQIYEAGPMFLPIVCAFSRTLFWNFVKNYPVDLGQQERLINDWWLEL